MTLLRFILRRKLHWCACKMCKSGCHCGRTEMGCFE